MKPRHQISRAAIELIKRFEGFRRSAARLPDGRWTIGYGHVKTAREGVEINESDAEALLIYDLLEITSAVNDLTFTPLTQNQFDALTCFAFNIGVDNFRRSTVLRRINEGAMLQAACALEVWRKAEFEGEWIVVDALVRRRAAEKTLFLTPTDGWVPAPSPVVRPSRDESLGCNSPRQKITTLSVPLDGAETSMREVAVELIAASPDIADQLEAAALSGVQAQPAPAPQPVTAPQTVTAIAAAQSVTARLQALMPEPEAAQTEAPQPEAPQPEVARTEVPAAAPKGESLSDLAPPPFPPAISEPAPAAAMDFALTPPDDKDDEPPFAPAAVYDPQPELEAAGPGLFEQAPAFAPVRDMAPVREMAAPRANADLANRVVRQPPVRSEGLEPDFFESEAEPGRVGGWPLLLLALIGLAIFAGGVFWGFNAAPDSTSGVVNAVTVGWAAGLIGIGCVATAVYFLLEKLGARED